MLLSEIAKHIEGRLEGNDRHIKGVSTLDDAGQDDITFLANPKYTNKALATKAGAIIVSSKIEKDISQIIVANSYHGYAKTLRLIYPQKVHKQGISDMAFVGEDARV
jgi:UDP-3-O-[3-hydroxymyristoyl] glucosamine N-acyltransferase